MIFVADEQREMSEAVGLINRGFAPDGSDAAMPTTILVDQHGEVRWIDRPSRFISRPSAAQLAVVLRLHQH